MVFVVVGTYTKRVINEFALEQGSGWLKVRESGN